MADYFKHLSLEGFLTLATVIVVASLGLEAIIRHIVAKRRAKKRCRPVKVFDRYTGGK